MDPLVPERLRMVERDLVSRGISDPAVLDAMRTVPRHLFVTAGNVKHAYADEALSLPEGQSISQPYIVALMLEQAKVRPTDRLLEVGTGSGYSAAVASLLCREVFSIERLPSLAQLAAINLAHVPNVHLQCGDGTLGWPQYAPFDAIIVAAAGLVIPPGLMDQLAIGGRLVMPLGRDEEQKLVRLTRTSPGEHVREDLISVRFVPLIGAHAGR